MATVAEPHPVSDTGTSSAAQSFKRIKPESGPADQARTHHLRNEIIVLVVFCVVMLFVFLMRNYAN
jgi:hypothetical protein